MSAVQIPEEFTAWVTSHWYLLRLHSRLHPCIHDASGQDAAEQIAADRLPAFQRKDTDRICMVVLRGIRLVVV